MNARKLTRREWLARTGAATVFGCRYAGAQPKQPQPDSVTNALKFVARMHDRFHDKFVIFDDHGSGGCHMFPSGWMGDLVPVKANNAAPDPPWVQIVFRERHVEPAVDGTCLRVEYPAVIAKTGEKGWAAVGWQAPLDQNKNRVDYNLRRFAGGATLVFKARGQRGGELIEFKSHAEQGPVKATRLGREWKTYTIKLESGFFDKLTAEAFVWAVSANHNRDGCVFYLDDIHIRFSDVATKLRRAEPRFVRSYCPEPTDSPDKHFRNVCFAYDQALAVSALVATGYPDHLHRARLIGDAIVYAIANDRFYKDGRIRNGYICGDLAGIGPKGPIGPTRLPGWWDFDQRAWLEDAYFAGSDCGNTAWVILGLLNLWEATVRSGAESPKYLQAARQLANWVARHFRCPDKVGGFFGGFEGFEPTQKKSTWRSTEHNIDLFCAFTRLADAARAEKAKYKDLAKRTEGFAQRLVNRHADAAEADEAKYQDLAKHAEGFVTCMFDGTKTFLYTGTQEGKPDANTRPIPLDVQAWSLLAFRDKGKFGRAVEWAGRECRVELGDTKSVGYDFDTDRDGIWFEGTAQMVVAFRMLGRQVEADAALATIRNEGLVRMPVATGTSAKAKRLPNQDADGGVRAASLDGLTTGFIKEWGNPPKEKPWVYYNRAHLGATCWYVLAELGWNPFWGTPARPLR